MTLDISLNSKNDVVALNREAAKSKEVLWVHSKDDVVMVDAKSLLALCSLVGKPCRLVAEDSADPKEVVRVARRAGVIA